MRRYFQLAVTCLAGLGMMACSSTILSSSWKNPDYSSRISKPYIIAVFENETERRLYEDNFNRLLSEYGVRGFSSYKDLAASRETDKQTIAGKVKQNGADSVLIVRVINKRTEEVVEPGRVTGYDSRPLYPRRDRPSKRHIPKDHYYDYGDYYSRSYQVVYEPPKVSSFNVDTLETNLYDAGRAEMVWSAQFEMIEEGNKGAMLEDFVKQAVKEMNKEGLL